MGGGLYGEVQCIMDNDHMGTPCEQNDRQTRLKTSPSRNFVIGWQICKICFKSRCRSVYTDHYAVLALDCV